MPKQKQLILFFLVLFSFASKAQNSLFIKTVDSINAIIKDNPMMYFMYDKHSDAFVKKISVTEEGVISFADSIAPAIVSANSNKVIVLPDCCPQKNSRTLNILIVKKWDIHFPNAYLYDENNERIGRIIGLKKTDMEHLKVQFDLLQSLCLDYVMKRGEAKEKAIAERYRCDELDLKRKAAAEEAMKKADKLNANKK
jgi:hypothetical protein